MKHSSIILWLNAYRGDSSACIVIDGELVAAVEVERFSSQPNSLHPGGARIIMTGRGCRAQ
ncbi:MAG: hypothetical protein FIA94_04725 [Nitrospirae bacterium]|nr:hypothetical protein [Nitrospirota bacterium]